MTLHLEFIFSPPTFPHTIIPSCDWPRNCWWLTTCQRSHQKLVVQQQRDKLTELVEIVNRTITLSKAMKSQLCNYDRTIPSFCCFSTQFLHLISDDFGNLEQQSVFRCFYVHPAYWEPVSYLDSSTQHATTDKSHVISSSGVVKRWGIV